MGAQNSNLRKSIEDEFTSRVASHARDWLNLGELLGLQLPQSGWSIDLAHLGVLYVLDKEHDGRFTLPNVLDLLEFGREQSRLHQPYEFAAQLSGFCTLQMWQAISQQGGVDRFAEWLCRLMQECMVVMTLNRYPGVTFLNRDSLKSLHNILDVQGYQQLDFQAFFDILQRHAEEDEYLDPEDERLDDWLPLPTLKVLAQSIGEGIISTADQICPMPKQRST